MRTIRNPARCAGSSCAPGKITWDLMAARAQREIDDVAIIRVERLYPMPGEEIAEARAISSRCRTGMGAGGTDEPGAYQYGMAINPPEFLSVLDRCGLLRPLGSAFDRLTPGARRGAARNRRQSPQLAGCWDVNSPTAE